MGLLAGLSWSELRKVVVRPTSLNEDEWPASLPLRAEVPGNQRLAVLVA